MVHQNKSIDKKANELDLDSHMGRRPAYGSCSPPLPDGYSNLKPEWLKVPDAVRVSGLGRSTLYELIKSNRIKSFSNRQRGARHGTRLISYDSLVDYLEKAYENWLKRSVEVNQIGGTSDE
jgi:hypothetical protein